MYYCLLHTIVNNERQLQYFNNCFAKSFSGVSIHEMLMFNSSLLFKVINLHKQIWEPSNKSKIKFDWIITLSALKI